MSTADESDAEVFEALRYYRARISARNKEVCRTLIAYTEGDRTHPELQRCPVQRPPDDMTPAQVTRAKFNFICDHIGLPEDQREAFHGTEELLENWDWLAPRCDLDGTSSNISFSPCVVDRESYKRGIMAGLQGSVGDAAEIPFPQNLWAILGEIGRLHGPNWPWQEIFPQGPGITCMIDLEQIGETQAKESVMTAENFDHEYNTWEDFNDIDSHGGGSVEVSAVIHIGDAIALGECYLVYSRTSTCGDKDCEHHGWGGDESAPAEPPWRWRWAIDRLEDGIQAMEDTSTMLEWIRCYDYGEELDSVWSMNIGMTSIYRP